MQKRINQITVVPVVGMFMMLLLLAPVAAFGVTPDNFEEADLHKKINAERLANCLPIISKNSTIDEAALGWATKMAKDGLYKHNPNFSTTLPGNWNIAGENIAWGQPDSAWLMTFWMNSPEHRANLLNPRFTDLGISFVRAPGKEFASYSTLVLAGYPESQQGYFLDVRGEHQFFNSISWLQSTGLTTGSKLNGCDVERIFRPKDTVSREAVAAFLFRQFAPESYEPPSTPYFTDVPTDHQFYHHISWMKESGLSTGSKVGNSYEYRPEHGVSREAMAAFLYRMGEPDVDTGTMSPFLDLNQGSKFYKEILWMYNLGITTGSHTSAGLLYRPKADVSREAVAAFLYRYDQQ